MGARLRAYVYTFRRNTGMASGKFLERMKLYKPGTSGTKLKYYVQSDFYINATVVAQVHFFFPTHSKYYLRSDLLYINATVVAQVHFFVLPHSKCIFQA